MFGNLGSGELLIIAVIVLLFFGSKKLNELARGLGQSTKEYKKLKKEFTKAVNEDFDDEEEEEKEKVGSKGPDEK